MNRLLTYLILLIVASAAVGCGDSTGESSFENAIPERETENMDSARYYYELASNCEKDEKYTIGLEHLKIAQSFAKDSSSIIWHCYSEMGLISAKMGKYPEAEKYLNKVINFKDPMAIAYSNGDTSYIKYTNNRRIAAGHSNMAYIYRLKGDTTGACKQYLFVIELFDSFSEEEKKMYKDVIEKYCPQLIE